MEDGPPYLVDFSGFFDECIDRWTAAAEGSPAVVVWFDVIRRVRITEYWLVESSKLSSVMAHVPGNQLADATSERLGIMVEAHLEAFYLSAFQLQEEVEYMARAGVRARAFKANGITRVRNQLIVHQHNQGNKPQGFALSCAGNGDAHLRLGWRGSMPEPNWQDPGLHANADELRLAFLNAILP